MKTPKRIIDFKIDLYALKEYRSWTDEDLGKQLGVTSRTVMNMRKNPCSVNGGLILRVQDMRREAEEKY